MRQSLVLCLGSFGVLAMACDDAAPRERDTDVAEVADVADVAEVAVTDTAEPGEVDAALPEAEVAADVPAEVAADVPAEVADAEASPTCPSPPFGTAVGDTLADYTLYTCEGEPVALSSACDRDVTFLNLFAGWCPPCNSHAQTAPADYADLAAGPASLAWLFVITEDSTGAPADLDYCAAVRESYALPMTVLVDLDGRLPDHLGLGSPNSWYLVMSSGLRLEARFKYDKDGALERARELGGR